MRTKIFLILSGLFCFTLNAQVNFVWAKQIGSSFIDNGNAIAVDANGNSYTTGSFNGTVDFDPGAGVYTLTASGSTDIFICKLDVNGNFVWAKSMGGTSNSDVAWAITLDGSGNIYTTGFFSGTADFDPGAGIANLTSAGGSDIFISKLDASGNYVWAKGMGSSGITNNDEGRGIAVDGSGNVYTTGNFYGTVDFDPNGGTYNLTSNGFQDIFISKLDASGNFVWAGAGGSAGGIDLSFGITLDASGNVYITGTFMNTVDFDLVTAGVYNITATGIQDVFVTKFSSSGNLVWAKNLGGSGAVGSGYGITNDGSNVYLTGHFSGTVDFDPGVGSFTITSGGQDVFISKLSSAGNFIWAKSMAGTTSAIGYSIFLDSNSNVYTTGFFGGTVDFDPGAGTFNLSSGGNTSIFVSKLNSSGNFKWAVSMGGAIYSNDLGVGVALDPNRNVYTTGHFFGTTDFDPGAGSYTLTPNGSYDVFIHKMCQNPDIIDPISGNIIICSGSNNTYSIPAVFGALSYTWTLPGGWSGSSSTNSISTTAGSSGGVISVVCSNTCGISNTKTLSVTVASLAVTANNATICSGQGATLTASGGSSYTWNPGPVVGNPVVVTPTTNTTYSVTGSNSVGCTAQTTASVTVLSSTPSFSVSLSELFVCLTSNTTILTVSPAGTYTLIAPGASPQAFNTTITLNPTVTATYSVANSNPNGCVATVTVQVTLVPCACLSANGSTLSGVINPVTIQPYDGYRIVGNVTLTPSNIGGPPSFYHNEVTVFPGVQIYITDNAAGVISIEGSYFHGCGEMWEGIVLPNKQTQLNIIPSYDPAYQTSLIEDAKIAVNVLNSIPFNTTAPVPAYVLNVDNSTFNQNITAIRIADYEETDTDTRYSIKNSLFTSRNIPITPVTNSIAIWPLTSTVKNSTVTGNSMQTPYINNTTYSPAPFTSTIYSYNGYGSTGIELNTVGLTTLTPNYQFIGIEIGAVGTNSFNCFDNMITDIFAYNSNLTVINSVFQNGQRTGNGYIAGGRGIMTYSDYDVQVHRNSVKISGSGSGCFFYEKTVAADIKDYFNVEIENASVYSFLNHYSLLNSYNTFGGIGFNIKTNRYQNISLESNKLYNIKNAMLIGLTNIALDPAPYAYREAGHINVESNIVNRYIGTVPPGSAPYINVGLSISDPLTVAQYTTTYSPLTTAVTNNSFTSVNNGINVMNLSFTPLGISGNTIVAVNETPTYSLSPTQKGIFVGQSLKHTYIHTNQITGPAVWGDSLKGIMTAYNSSLSVRCNTAANVARNIEFNGTQYTDFFEDNHMNASNNTAPAYGLMMDHNAVLSGTTSAIGSSTRPTNNVWNGTWSTPNYMTFTDLGSTAQNSKLYVQYGSTTLDPDGNGLTTGINSPPTPELYFHSGIPGGIVTLLSASTGSTSCRIGTGNGGGNNAARILLEQAVMDSIPYSLNVSEAQHINKTYAYLSLKANPGLLGSSAILDTFYVHAQSKYLQAMVSVEENLAHNNIATAQTQIAALSSTNAIEANYKSFYGVFANVKDYTSGVMDSLTITDSDSLVLVDLANMCPYIDGAVVFQARALYNIIFDGFYKFYDDCDAGGGGRSGATPAPLAKMFNETEINVLLKTTLYPNPNDGNYVLKFSNPDFKRDEKQSIEISIFDITGRQVAKENKFLNGENQLNLSTNLLNGTYLVKVRLEDGTIDVHRLIISK